MRKLSFCLGVVGLVLTACSAPRVEVNTERTTYLTGYYQYGAGDRDLALTVRGNPFPQTDQASLDQVVERAAGDGGILRPATRPRLHPDDSARPGYGLILAFSSAPAYGPQDLCDGKGGGSGVGNGEVAVIGVFCVSGRAVSHSAGWVTVTDPQDPQFAKLIGMVVSQIFRADDTVQGDGNSAP